MFHFLSPSLQRVSTFYIVLHSVGVDTINHADAQKKQLDDFTKTRRFTETEENKPIFDIKARYYDHAYSVCTRPLTTTIMYCVQGDGGG